MKKHDEIKECSKTSTSSYTREKKVHVKKSEETVIDEDFKSIRDKFDAEMKRMENDMAEFKDKLSERRREFETRSMSPLSRSREMKSFIEDFDSPLIKDTKDGRFLTLKFDLTDYEPEEIVVKTVDNKLQVHAKHEEKSETKSIFREYNREFLLPEGTIPETIRSSLSREGVLTVYSKIPADHKA